MLDAFMGVKHNNLKAAGQIQIWTGNRATTPGDPKAITGIIALGLLYNGKAKELSSPTPRDQYRRRFTRGEA
jgi:hypothetical protein